MSLGRGARLCLRPHDPTPAHTIASTHPPCLPACVAPRQSHQSGHATPGVLLLFVEVLAAPRSLRVPPTTIATNPAVTLLETTVILINKQLHLCKLLCEPGRVLRQAVRPKRELPRCARPLFVSTDHMTSLPS